MKSNFKGSFFALLMPVIILGGIYLGIFTPTEVSIIAAIYALFISLMIYKTIRIGYIPTILKNTIHSTAMIYLVLIGGTLLGFILTRMGVATSILGFIQSIDMPVWMFLIIVNIILLLLGMFLDGISLIVILAPILFPIAIGMGVDPIHFAVIMVANVEIATITPPVGLNLFVMSGVTKLSIGEVVQGVAPFYIVRIIGLALITFFPFFSLWLL